MTRGYLSLRIDDTNPAHHLAVNTGGRSNGCWWVAYTLHFDSRKRRIRRSLGTKCLTAAIRLRDELFARIERDGEEVPERRPRRTDEDEMRPLFLRVVTSRRIPAAEKDVLLTFSDQPFDGHDVVRRWTHGDAEGGNWYEGNVRGEPVDNWPGPAPLPSFEKPPARLSVRCDPLPAGVNPIWDARTAGHGRRFVEAPR